VRPDASWAEEEIFVNFVVLLLYAFREGEVSLGVLREWLMECMQRFPYNAAVFLVFVQMEDRHGLSHRVRAYWEGMWERGATTSQNAAAWLGPSPSIVTIMVRFELRRNCVPRAVGVLERALQKRETRHCAVLWRLLMDVLVGAGKVRNVDAARLLNSAAACRAARVCWCTRPLHVSLNLDVSLDVTCGARLIDR